MREIDMALRGLTIDQKPLKDHKEAVGHKEAFDFARDLVKELERFIGLLRERLDELP